MTIVINLGINVGTFPELVDRYNIILRSHPNGFVAFFLSLLDTDEVIVPQIDLSLPHMMDRIQNAPQNAADIQEFDAFMFDHVYFFKGFFPRKLNSKEMVPRYARV